MAARSRGKKRKSRRVVRAAWAAKAEAKARARAKPISTKIVQAVQPEIVAPGDGLVEATVRYINLVYTDAAERAAQGLLKIGQYIFSRFFNNDPELVQFRGRKNASFRSLANHPELELSRSGLHSAVALAVQEKSLNDASVQTSGYLLVSHRAALLRVADVDLKRRLIEEVGEERLSVRALRQRIDQLIGGRPRLPAGPRGNANGSWSVPKPIQALAKLDLDRVIVPGKLDDLEDSHRKACLECLGQAELRIQKMIRALEAAG